MYNSKQCNTIICITRLCRQPQLLLHHSYSLFLPHKNNNNKNIHINTHLSTPVYFYLYIRGPPGICSNNYDCFCVRTYLYTKIIDFTMDYNILLLLKNVFHITTLFCIVIFIYKYEYAIIHIKISTRLIAADHLYTYVRT